MQIVKIVCILIDVKCHTLNIVVVINYQNHFLSPLIITNRILVNIIIIIIDDFGYLHNT